jgi:outer membrane protein assembly factor BamB
VFTLQIQSLPEVLNMFDINKSNYLMIIALTASALASGRSSADWPGFLGPSGNGVVVDASAPIDFATGKEGVGGKNIAWRTSLPGRSVSGPIIVGNKVITTSSAGMEGRWLHVSAVDADSGKVVWDRASKATGRPFCHPTSANAAPTPCTDGQRIFAFFSSNDLVCYDVNGNLQWYRGLSYDHPQAGNDVGMSSSPLVVDGTVIVMIDCQADSFATGIDAVTGETKWEMARPRKANWSSPRLATAADGTHAVVLQGADEMVAIEAASGRQLWTLDAKCSTVASAVFARGKLHVPAGGTKTYELKTATEPPQLVWESSRINPNSSSLLVTDIGVLGLNRTVLVCCDEKGEMKWQARLGDAGQFWATPVVAGQHMYAFAMNGKCFTIQLSDTSGEVVATSELGEDVLGSPAIHGNAIFVRSVGALWKLAKE